MALYENLAQAYDELFPPNPATISFIRSLDIGKAESTQPAPKVLDIGTATGSDLLALAALGWEATGLEPDRSLLERARAKAAERKTPVQLLSAGMEDVSELFAASSFDLVLCLGNTLPHLRSREAIGSFLAAVRRLLRPGGVLILQLLNYRIFRAGSVLPALSAGRFTFRRRYSEAGGRFLAFETELEGAEGGILRDRTLLFPIPPKELGTALETAGFSDPVRYAGWEAKAFEEERSPFLILLART